MSNGLASARRVYQRAFDSAGHQTLAFFRRSLAIGRSDRFLDIGGGSGVWALALASLAGSVCYLDKEVGDYGRIVDVRAKITERVPQARVLFVKGDAECLPFSSDTIDKLLCAEVLEHVANPEVVFAELGRVLKPGGRAVVTTTPTHGFIADYNWPVRGFLLRVLPSVLCRTTYMREGLDAHNRRLGHVNSYSAADLRAYATNAHLDVVEQHFMHQRGLGALLVELNWALPVAGLVLQALSPLVYALEARMFRDGLSIHLALTKSD